MGVGARLAKGCVMAQTTFLRGLAVLFCASLLSAAAGSVLGCSAETTTQTVPLLTAAGVPITQTPQGDISLEVVTRSTAVKDPLPVTGSHFSYADLESTLGHAVTTATIPWADSHKNARPGGLQLVVDVSEANVDFDAGRLSVTINVRATLRTRRDHDYIAQTEASCRDAGLTDPSHGATVIYRCMTRLGRDLTGWLGGIPVASPQAVSTNDN
jgi:hypothetical protein